MSIKTKSYPNPVLGNGEDYRIDIDGKVLNFTAISKDNDYFYSTITLNLEDEIIMNLIKERKAAFICDIDCIKTNYRTKQWVYEDKLELKIPRVNVVDTVDVNCYIVAMMPIDDFRHVDFNDMYSDESFSLEEGDFIADLGSYYFNASVKYSKRPAPSSLMQVQRATPESGITRIQFNTDEERIYIIMPPEMYDIYTRVCGQKNTYADDLFVSTIAVDALAYAIMTLKDADTKLAENIRNLLKNKDIEIEDEHPEQCFDAARKLLEEDGIDPYTTFMKKVEAVMSIKQTWGNGDTE